MILSYPEGKIYSEKDDNFEIMRILNVLLVICTFCGMQGGVVMAQSVNQIKADKATYLWGEGRGNTLKKADNEALSDLINQISTTVESNFTLLQEEKGEAGYEETLNSVIRTYSNATLNNTERIVIEDEPDARVLRYINRVEIEKIFVSRKNKILEYTANAEVAERNLQIADALRYYYWAHTLLRSHPDGAGIRYEDEEGKEQLLATWIPLRINTLFSHLGVRIMQVNKEEGYQTAELMILYNGKPVRNFDYTYWDGRDWSNLVSAKDGRGIVELPALADATHIRLKGEYVFDGEATLDAELRDVINKLDVVPFRSCYLDAIQNLPAYPQGAEDMGIRVLPEGASHAQAFFKPVKDGSRYLSVMKKIEQAIRNKRYEEVRNCFTSEGYDMFTRLIRYGKAQIVGTPDYKMVAGEDGIFCRSMPLSFRFENNNRTFVEDVVFDFSTEARVKSLSFGLSKSALEDITAKTMWGEQSRMTLIRFLENYQTAYALKRLDYVESIFADDALIIVGSVLKKQAVTDRQVVLDRQSVKYTRQTKEQYIKRLRATFASNEFINLHFADNQIRKSGTQGELYGIQIRQDYFSTNYGDTGYLFLMVDLNDVKKPVIHVRAWQPEKDPDFGLIDLSHFTF